MLEPEEHALFSLMRGEESGMPSPLIMKTCGWNVRSWAEQRPENWWDAAQSAIRGVLGAAGASGRDVRGIGLSGQMHGLVLLDESDHVIRPALIWCDQRSQAQVDSINASVGKGTRPFLYCQSGPHRFHATKTALGS
jgi:sugar (pentulose or hexulose) kinase